MPPSQVIQLRRKIWDDGYILFQAPWPGYNNMNLVIMKQTKAVKAYFAAHPPSANKLPTFAKELRASAVSAEVTIVRRSILPV